MSKQSISAPRRSTFLVDPNTDLVLIGRDTEDGTNHPRYDDRVHNKFEEDIVLGMLKFGIKKAIVVFKNEADQLEVVDGKQRTINAREANRRLKESGLPPLRIPCLAPEKGLNDGELMSLMVLLNEHRQEDSAIGRARKAQTMINMGYTPAEIAPLFHCSEGSVRNYLSLLNLNPELQTRVASGETPATVGYQLAGKGPAAQAKYLEKLKGGAPEASARPSGPKAAPKTTLKFLLTQDQLPEDFRAGVAFALGVLSDLTNVQGLTEALSPEPTETPPDEDASEPNWHTLGQAFKGVLSNMGPS